MKTKLKTRKLSAVGLGLLMATAPMALLAQDDALLADTDSILNSEQIDIDGTFQRESAADRVAKMRKKLEKQSEEMVQKKIEDIRVKNEQKLANDLNKAFRGGLNNMDTVAVTQAAPQKVVAPAPAPEPKKEDKKNKVIAAFGVDQYNGQEIDSFESNIAANISVENMITDRIGLGVGVGHTSMDVEIENDFNNFYGVGVTYPYSGFGTATSGDEVSYKRLNLNVHGKFYFTRDSKIGPYAGAGLGYNRVTLRYEDKNDPFTSGGYGNNFDNGDESVSGSYVSGMAMVGAEVGFTDTVGMNLEFNYGRALTAAFDRDERDANDLGFGESLLETRLKNLGSMLEDADVASLKAGLIISF